MNIEGFISFYSDDVPIQQKENNIIAWNSGYIKLVDDKSIASFKILIGVENEKEVKLLGSTLPKSLTSFFEFGEYLRRASGEIDVGIWFDGAKNQLYIARQLFGMCPMYYIHVPNQFTAFSTSLAGLVKMRPLKSHISVDNNRVVNYTTFRVDQSTDYSEDTFYTHIKSVLPGQILSLTPEKKTYSSFATFSISEWAGLRSLPEYAEAFRDLLIASVRKNTDDSSQLIGSHLSGGLDSSSVSSIVKLLYPERPLHTFYYSTRSYTTDDNEYARSVAKNIGSIHHELDQPTNDLAIIQQKTDIIGRPIGSLMSPSSEAAVMQIAKSLKCNVLLNGNDGDSIVGSGLELPELLFKNKDYVTLKTLLRQRVNFFSMANQYANWDLLSFEEKVSIVEQNFIYNRLTSQFGRVGLLDSYKAFKDLSEHFKLNPGYFVKRALQGFNAKLKKQSIQPVTLMRDDFSKLHASQTLFENQLSAILKGNLSSDYQQWFRDVFNHHSIAQNEEKFALANFHGFKNGSPFYDKRLFELCISIPAITKFGNGQGRVHFREAMKGILPEHVRVRHQKATVGSFGKQVTLRLYEQSRELLMDTSEVWKIIDKDKFVKSIEFLQTDGLDDRMYSRTLFQITRTVSLAVWFEWMKSNDIHIKF